MKGKERRGEMEAEERGGREGKKKRTGEGTENGRGRRGRGREGRTKQAGTPRPRAATC